MVPASDSLLGLFASAGTSVMHVLCYGEAPALLLTAPPHVSLAHTGTTCVWHVLLCYVIAHPYLG